jgi:hypothetical protein
MKSDKFVSTVADMMSLFDADKLSASGDGFEETKLCITYREESKVMSYVRYSWDD